jgi:acylglycerol lipase
MIHSVATPGITVGGMHELRRTWQPRSDPVAEVVLVHGQAEHSGRYEHVGSLLAEGGMTVRGFDLIGHGASGGRRGDIADWSMFLDQIQEHMERALATGRPTVLFAHSTGPLMCLDYVLSERPDPDLCVFSAPALRVADDFRTRLLRPLVPMLASLFPTMALRAPVRPDQLSRDPSVGEAYVADPLVHRPVTFRYAHAYLEAEDRVNAHLEGLSVPTLVLHGGMDTIVLPEVSVELGERLGVERRVYPTLRHEVYNEPEGPALVAEVLEWIRGRLALQA